MELKHPWAISGYRSFRLIGFTLVAVVVVFNPAAGRRRAQGLWRVLDVLLANGVRLELAETSHAGHATILARQAACKGASLVVAAGGDGTIAEVANGLIGQRALLGIIPLGTANVLARELALPFAPDAIAAALAFRRTRTLWPGLARRPGGELLFVQMLGVGFDAQVVHQLSLPLKRVLGRGAYVFQTLRELARYPFQPIRMCIDGKDVVAGSAIVSKGRLYAGPYTLAPDAVPTEPGFHVALFHRSGPAATLVYGAALPLHLLPKVPGVTLMRARHIEMLGTSVPAQADGDPAGHTPLTIMDAPAPLQVVVG
jgi:diacylglycerol kinase family enzyme